MIGGKESLQIFRQYVNAAAPPPVYGLSTSSMWSVWVRSCVVGELRSARTHYEQDVEAARQRRNRKQKTGSTSAVWQTQASQKWAPQRRGRRRRQEASRRGSTPSAGLDGCSPLTWDAPQRTVYTHTYWTATHRRNTSHPVAEPWEATMASLGDCCVKVALR